MFCGILSLADVSGHRSGAHRHSSVRSIATHKQAQASIMSGFCASSGPYHNSAYKATLAIGGSAVV